jgi:hypothetical protein
MCLYCLIGIGGANLTLYVYKETNTNRYSDTNMYAALNLDTF